MKKNLRSNELQKAKQVSGNVLTELNEAELGSISGAGEVRGSNGGFCTFTADQFFTLICCKCAKVTR